MNCPVCGSENNRSYLTVAEYTAGTYYLCECSAAFLNPMPENLTEWYSSGAYRAKVNGFDPGLESTIEQQTARAKLVADSIQTPILSHLDIGCSNGSLLKAVRDKFPCVKSIGVDIDTVLKTTDFPVYKTIQEAPGTFDLITIMQTLEHMPNPREVVAEIYKRLNPDGVIMVEVPNRRAYLTAYAPPEHVIAFDEKSLRYLFEQFVKVQVVFHGQPNKSPLDLHILLVGHK
jgi:SAM-dependent methyltransferase